MAEENYKVIRSHLYEQIAENLREIIINEHMQENDRLPSEQILAERFGVSRNIIREALKTLKERGLVEMRNGTGIYITRPDAGNLSNIISCMVAMDHIGYIDIYDVRIILEESAAEIAATCVTDDEIDRMETLLQHLDNTMLSVKERREADFQFHIEIAKATKNMLLVILIQTMKNIFIDMIETGIFLQGGIADAAARHRKILDALKAHDPVLARQSMHEHLLVSRENTKKVYLDREKAKLLNKKHDGKTEEANC